MSNSQNFVEVYTNLPPLVNKADVYFNLTVTVSNIKWIVKSITNYDDYAVRMIWWGEESKGAEFLPRCANLAGYKQNIRATAFYKVCVPFDTFHNYLLDMQKLYINVIDKNQSCIVGRVVVDKIYELTSQKVLNKVVDILNDKNVKLGELCLSFMLEPVKSKHNFIMKQGDLNTTKTIAEKPEGESNKENINLNNNIGDKSIEEASGQEVDNFLDELIEKGHQLRNEIDMNVKQYSDILPSESKDSWLLNQVIRGNDDESEAVTARNTESLWRSIGKLERGAQKQLPRQQEDEDIRNDDTEVMKLILSSDDDNDKASNYSLDESGTLHNTKSSLPYRRHRDLRESFEQNCIHDSLIEELFYKTQDSSPIKQVSSTAQDDDNKNYNVSKEAQQPTDFEIYKSLIDSPQIQANNQQNCVINNNDMKSTANQCNNHNNWYENITGIQVSIDTLWINHSNSNAGALSSSGCLVRARSHSNSGRSRSASPSVRGAATTQGDLRRSMESNQSSTQNLVSCSSSASLAKPPSPSNRQFQWNSDCRYYIEYKFPGGTPARISIHPSTQQTQYAATPSNMVHAKLPPAQSPRDTNCTSLLINHSAHYPVVLHESIVARHWWRNIIKFKLIAQDKYSQKESLVALATLPLRNIITNDNFYRILPIRLPRTNPNHMHGKLANQMSRSPNKLVVIGSLAIRTNMLMTSQIEHNTSNNSNNNNQLQHPTLEIPNNNNSHYDYRATVPINYKVLGNVPVSGYLSLHKAPLSDRKLPIKMEPMSMESLLIVSYVRNIHQIAGALQLNSTNLYLVGRMLWCKDRPIKSRVMWGLNNPHSIDDNQNNSSTSSANQISSSIQLDNFKIVERMPLILSNQMLEKFKDNFAILELWNKSSPNQIKTKDHLFGLVKLPTNIFHLSFIHEKIRRTVLNNNYPVLSCDEWLVIEDPITGKSKGQLHVLLAMGTSQQIDQLSLSKEANNIGQWARISSRDNEFVEHTIELDVENISQMKINKQSIINQGDCYCFVQYYFPYQKLHTDSGAAQSLETVIYRTASLPLAESVEICDSNTHRFRLPLDQSLKSVINQYYQGNESASILMEVYIKQYRPFPSNELVAKARLLISSIYTMLNQHVTQFNCIDTVTQQCLNLRLAPTEGIGSPYNGYLEPSGLSGAGYYNNRSGRVGDGVREDDNDDDVVNNKVSLGKLQIRLCYKTRIVHQPRSKNLHKGSPVDQPLLKISVQSAHGIQAAARSLVDTHPELEYPSIVGVNSLVKFWISDYNNKFNGKDSSRYHSKERSSVFTSEVCYRSFNPKFKDCVKEVLLSRLINEEGISLAEMILTGRYQFNCELYHLVTPSSDPDAIKFRECDSVQSKLLIGKGRISLVELLLKSNGSMGPLLLPLFNPLTLDPSHSGYLLNCKSSSGCIKANNYTSSNIDYLMNRRQCVGAVEIKLSLGEGADDRRNILQVAMDSGYVLTWTCRLDTEDSNWISMDASGAPYKVVTITIEELELSGKLLNSVFTPEVGFNRSEIRLLLRYRLFKQSVCQTPNFLLSANEIEEQRIFIPVNYRKELCYRISNELYRYLRENKLDIQLWAIYGFGNNAAINSCYHSNQFDCTTTPSSSDVRLVSIATVDLSQLIVDSANDTSHSNSSRSNRKLIGGLCLPLLKKGAADCDNSNITVTMEINSSHSPIDGYDSGQEDAQINKTGGSTMSYRGSSQSARFIPVHVSIDKSVNINYPPININSDSDVEQPYYFCSVVNDETNQQIYSPLIRGYHDIQWNFECDLKLHTEKIYNDEHLFVVKVYYSTSQSNLDPEIRDSKVLLGNAKVDVSLLSRGFERTVGWYNIEDLQGQCQGQVKLACSPLVQITKKKPSRSELSGDHSNTTIRCYQGNNLRSNNNIPMATFANVHQITNNKSAITIDDHIDYLQSVRQRLYGNVTDIASAQLPDHSQILQQQSSANQNDLTKSMLYSTLREKMQQLDAMKQSLDSRYTKKDVVCHGSNAELNLSIHGKFGSQDHIHHDNEFLPREGQLTGDAVKVTKETCDTLSNSCHSDNEANCASFGQMFPSYRIQGDEHEISKCTTPASEEEEKEDRSHKPLAARERDEETDGDESSFNVEDQDDEEEEEASSMIFQQRIVHDVSELQDNNHNFHSDDEDSFSERSSIKSTDKIDPLIQYPIDKSNEGKQQDSNLNDSMHNYIDYSPQNTQPYSPQHLQQSSPQHPQISRQHTHNPQHFSQHPQHHQDILVHQSCDMESLNSWSSDVEQLHQNNQQKAHSYNDGIKTGSVAIPPFFAHNIDYQEKMRLLQRRNEELLHNSSNQVSQTKRTQSLQATIERSEQLDERRMEKLAKIFGVKNQP